MRVATCNAVVAAMFLLLYLIRFVDLHHSFLMWFQSYTYRSSSFEPAQKLFFLAQSSLLLQPHTFSWSVSLLRQACS